MDKKVGAEGGIQKEESKGKKGGVRRCKAKILIREEKATMTLK